MTPNHALGPIAASGAFLEASGLVTGAFIILPLLVAAGFVLACEWAGRRLGERAAVRRRRTLGLSAAALAWLLVTAGFAASGVLRRFDTTPPPFAVLPLAVGVVGIAVSCSPLGTLLVRGLPLWVLVGFQVFRVPLELIMHRAYVEGVMPVQMSYAGQNYDILSGITAGVLGLWLALGRVPRWVVACWNFFGFALLVNIVTVAIVSTPLFRWFGNDRVNIFITYPPFVWLPGALVTAALVGHILVWRRLSEEMTTVGRTALATTATRLSLLVAVSMLAAPLAAGAQPAVNVARIGFLLPGSLTYPETRASLDALRSGLREHGYLEGQNIVVEYRAADGKIERLPGLATELTRLKVDVIVAFATPGVRAAQQATRTIPIVGVNMGDPVRDGFVASLARPGGNITGTTFLGPELVPKRFELLKEALPGASRVAILWHPDAFAEPTMREMLKEAEASKGLGVVRLTSGAKPANLPVEQPTQFELVINLKTAKALGLTIPRTLLLRADQVIE